MNTKRIEKLSTKEMSKIRGSEGSWIYTSEGWIWVGSRDLGGDLPPPPPPPNP